MALSGLMVPLGCIIAFIWSGVDYQGLESNDTEQIIKATNQMLWQQSIAVSAICVPFFFIIREKPEYPPSDVSLVEPEADANLCQLYA